MLIAWLSLHWGILPRLDDWRPQIEQRVGAAIGAPVSIGRIRVRSGSWVPAFELDDVRLLDRQGRVALALGRVSAALSPASLLALELRFAQLHLQGVSLDVRRAADGRVSVAGFELTGGDADAEPRALEWLLAQHELVVRGGTLRWTDERRAVPALTLSAVDIVLRNARRSHALRVDATPPADWGRPLQLRGEFTRGLTARIDDWARWRGTAYAELPEVDLSQLRRHVELPIELDQGRGAVRAWFDVADGRVALGTADLALTAVALRLAPELPVLGLAQLRGRVSSSDRADGLDLAVQQLAFTSDDGVPWAPSNLQLSLQRDANAGADAPWTGGRLTVDRLALAPLARLAARLPLPAAVHRGLAELAPQGEVQALALDWTGAPRAPTRYRAAAQARGLALAAGPPGPPAWGLPQTAGRPGLRGADLDVEATEAGGEARLAVATGALVFPGVFEQPELAVDSLAARLAWRIGPATADAPPSLQVDVREARFANADLRGTLSGGWRTGPGQGFGVGQRWPGIIDLTGRIDDGRAQSVVRYLPIGVPAATRAYLARAIGPGRITGADFRSQGDLWRFPFLDEGPGEFLVRGRVQDLHYAYIPSEPGWTSPWPALTAVAGEVEFNRAGMRLRGVRGETAGVVLQGVHGGIANLARDPVLQIEGQVRGPLADMLRFVNGTPVGGWIGGALRQASASGASELGLALAIPLDDPGRSTVRGALQLLGNDLRLLPGTPLLSQSRGRVDFTDQGVQVVGGRMRLLGGQATVEGGTQPDGTLLFSGQGTATAEGLLRTRDLPVLAPLAPWGGRLSGQAPYRVQLGFVRGLPELHVSSSLAGLALDLPPPLNKPATAAWPLDLRTRLVTDGRVADVLTLDLADRLQARYERDLSGPSVRVLRGAVGVGTAAPPVPADGVAARALLARLDVDAWRRSAAGGAAMASPAAVAGTGAAGAAASGDVATSAADAAGMAADVLPRRIELRTAELLAAGRRLHGVSLDLTRRARLADTVWRAEVQADEARGWVEWRPPRDAADAGRVSAHLTRLAWPAAEAAPADARTPSTAARVPAFSLVVDALEVQGRSLGRLEVQARNARADAGAPEWQLDQLRLASADATLLARGLWSPGARTSLAFDLDLADGGRFFERLGAGKALLGGPGRIDGELSWPGSPLDFEPAALRGRLAVALGEGRFPNAEPGAARLFGVLSLQALPRRLLLDFSDVFQQGMTFDTIAGDITLEEGIARTANLRVLGVQVGVLVEGSADLTRQTQDLRIVAVPELNTTTASLAWAALNPAVGIGAFVAQLLLREPMMAAATREFHVTGPWAAPVVERVDSLAAAPAASPPPVPEVRTP